jgi:RNA polymerase sigma-70 factor (family 1)
MSSEEGPFFSADPFKRLFDSYKNRIYGYVLAIAHSRYTAEEITQEIFIKLWVCRDLLSQVENLDGYIFTLARNRTLNYLRKVASDARLLRELQELAMPQHNNVEERVLETDYEQLLHDAVSMLSPQRRLVFQLSRDSGLNHAQIAAQLHLSRNTVKNHLVEALRFIRSYLGRHGSVLVLIFFLTH